MKYKAHEYQKFAEEHLLSTPYAGLFLEMGLGKTVTTLTALDKLMFDYFEISKVLVVAPKRVAESTWMQEAQKWDHLRHLRFSLVLGDQKQRKAALAKKADIYVINRENVAWLVAHYGGAFPFDGLVIDELSSFKSPSSARFKALRLVRPRIKRVIGLTGTPAPNGLIDLWPQIYLLDRGERLGTTVTGYRNTFFKPGRRKGHVVYDYKLNCDEKEIYDKISDICISMKEEDWLDMPELVEQDVVVRLSGEQQAQYSQFERDQVLSLGEGEITALSAAALTGKLLQYANGAVYTENPLFEDVHTAKIEALGEDLEALNGKPYLLFYQFRHDVERIRRYLKAYQPRLLEGSADVVDWNAGKIPFLIAHAASAGHGLNMQDGGNHIGWFGCPWSLELYQQANKRVHRQGQKSRVFMRRYLTEGTMDFDVVKALDAKADGQEALMQAVKARIRRYRAGAAQGSPLRSMSVAG